MNTQLVDVKSAWLSKINWTQAVSFDAATICLGTYYLIYPTRLLTDLARVVVDDAPLIMIYSNRWFPTKAVMPWLNLDDRGRGAFLREILLRTGAWNVVASLDCTPPGGDVLFAVIARRR